MEIEQRIHRGYEEWQKAVHEGYTFFKSVVGKYQYIYTSTKGKISLVELPNYFHDNQDLWEIYSLEGNLFDDVIRFDTKEEAEVKIKEFLDS